MCVACGVEFQTRGGRTFRCSACAKVWRQASKLHAAAKYRAGKAGIPFDLTIEWIDERLRRPCPRTGADFVLLFSSSDYTDRHPYGPSLDKIDPNGGYTMSNVQVVAWAYNCAKQRFTDEEVLELCHRVVATSSATSIANPAAAVTQTPCTTTGTPTASLAE